MIKKLIQSSLDKRYLELRQHIATAINVDFTKFVVNKPWGNEYLMFTNQHIGIWNLFIGCNKTTSMHCHPNKKSALIILEGSALFSSLNESIELFPLDAIVMEAGVFHSTQGISKGGVRLLEFETPPIKQDLVRLEDKYGRVNEGYEGIEKMIPDNTQIRLSCGDRGIIKNLHKNILGIHVVNNRKDVTKIVKNNGNLSLAVIISGAVFSKNKDLLFEPGDIVELDELNNDGSGNNTSYLFDNVQILSISRI